jgi:hypothetical protein
MIRIIENFSPRLEEVRQSALASGFGTWAPSKGVVGSSKYEGMNFKGSHAIMTHALSVHMGRPIFPNSMFFRVSKPETERAYYHSDRHDGTHTCVVYLSSHTEPFGTGFFRHIESGLTRMPSFEELAEYPEFFERLKRDMVEGTSEQWQQTHFSSGAFNNAVIFDAPLFHARHPIHGIGSSDETARLIWGCHFNLADGNGRLMDQHEPMDLSFLKSKTEVAT